jgi:serine/threonine-protein kinase
VAKLSGLGFAKNLSDAGLDRPTRPGERLGQLYFAAPEQLADARSATAQSDIYSLGAVLFFMLTGYAPFRGKTEQEILEQVMQGQHAALPPLRKDAPADLVAIVDRAMAPNPADRFGRASKLQEELRKVHRQLRM